MLLLPTIVSVFALGVAAQTSTPSTTSTITTASTRTSSSSTLSAITSRPNAIQSLTLFYPGADAPSLAVSIIAANPCNTTYAIGCQSSTARFGLARSCRSDMPYTYTAGPDYVAATTTGTFSGTPGTATVSCNIEGNSRALCTAIFRGSATAITDPVYTITNAGFKLLHTVVPVTANAEALTSTVGSCTVPHNTALPSGNAAPKIGVVKTIYKVAIVPAALVAGAALL